MQCTWIPVTLTVMLSLTPLFAVAENYYKYKDKEGQTVLSNSLPPEIANKGYQIINSQGGIVETVAPRKTSFELSQELILEKKRQEQERQAQLHRQEREIQARKDEILLRSFNSTKDIERSKEDKITAIEVLEQIIQENMGGLDRQLKEAKNNLRSYEDAGQPIPENVIRIIQESERQIKENEAFLERKKREKKEIKLKYDKLLNDFKNLQIQKIQENTPPSPAP